LNLIEFISLNEIIEVITWHKKDTNPRIIGHKKDTSHNLEEINHLADSKQETKAFVEI